MEEVKKVKIIYQIVLSQTKSGKSVSQFCLEKGLPVKVLTSWRQAFLKDSKHRNESWISIAGFIDRKQTSSIYHDDIILKAMKWLEIDIDNI